MSVYNASLWQVCVLLPLYLWLHQTTSVLSSHQLSFQTGAPDQTLSTGFLIQIPVSVTMEIQCCDPCGIQVPQTILLNCDKNPHKIALWLTFSAWGIKENTFIYMFENETVITIMCQCAKHFLTCEKSWN